MTDIHFTRSGSSHVTLQTAPSAETVKTSEAIKRYSFVKYVFLVLFSCFIKTRVKNLKALDANGKKVTLHLNKAQYDAWVGKPTTDKTKKVSATIPSLASLALRAANIDHGPLPAIPTTTSQPHSHDGIPLPPLPPEATARAAPALPPRTSTAAASSANLRSETPPAPPKNHAAASQGDMMSSIAALATARNARAEKARQDQLAAQATAPNGPAPTPPPREDTNPAAAARSSLRPTTPQLSPEQQKAALRQKLAAHMAKSGRG